MEGAVIAPHAKESICPSLFASASASVTLSKAQKRETSLPFGITDTSNSASPLFVYSSETAPPREQALSAPSLVITILGAGSSGTSLSESETAPVSALVSASLAASIVPIGIIQPSSTVSANAAILFRFLYISISSGSHISNADHSHNQYAYYKVNIVISIIIFYMYSIIWSMIYAGSRADKKRPESFLSRGASSCIHFFITDIFSAHPPCQVSPRADPNRFCQNVRKRQSACRSDGAGLTS